MTSSRPDLNPNIWLSRLCRWCWWSWFLVEQWPRVSGLRPRFRFPAWHRWGMVRVPDRHPAFAGGHSQCLTEACAVPAAPAGKHQLPSCVHVPTHSLFLLFCLPCQTLCCRFLKKSAWWIKLDLPSPPLSAGATSLPDRGLCEGPVSPPGPEGAALLLPVGPGDGGETGGQHSPPVHHCKPGSQHGGTQSPRVSITCWAVPLFWNLERTLNGCLSTVICVLQNCDFSFLIMLCCSYSNWDCTVGLFTALPVILYKSAY